MKDQNKSIWSSFTSSMAGPVGAHIYLKFDMVLGLDTNCPSMIYFVISLIQKGDIESFFPVSWKLSKVHFPTFGHFFLVVSSENLAMNTLKMDFSWKIQHINLDQ